MISQPQSFKSIAFWRTAAATAASTLAMVACAESGSEAAATSTSLPPPPSTAPTGFGPQLPRLVAETNVVEATLTPNEKTVRVVRIGADGNGPFEWDYIQSADTPWLDVTRPLVIEEGDLDTLILNFDSTGLSPGRYEAMVAIFAVPVARDSPQTIDVSLTVT